MKASYLIGLVFLSLSVGLSAREVAAGYAKVQRGDETYYAYVQFDFETAASDSEWKFSEVTLRYKGYEKPHNGVWVESDSSNAAKLDERKKLKTKSMYEVDAVTGKRTKVGSSPTRRKHVRVLSWKPNQEVVFTNPSNWGEELPFRMVFEPKVGWHLSGGGSYPIMDGKSSTTVTYEPVQKFELPNAVFGY